MSEDFEYLKDPYEVLGVERTVTAEQLKVTYRKLALRFHPDKNQGPGAEEAAERFKEIAQAYSILSDPEKRRKFDAGGYKNLQAEDLEVEVDLSSLGMFNTAFAAMFSRLGVPIKTAVAAHVLEAAYTGQYSARPLHFGEQYTDRVEKQGVHFYEIFVTQPHISVGFVIAAHSAIASKFKLLLFEQAPDGQWELAMQEDSTKIRKVTTAGLFFLPFATHNLGPRLTALEAANDPEAALFRRLESMRPRETTSIKPGKVLVAVYGDNWFKKVHYTIEAVLPVAPVITADRLRAVEGQLLQKRDELRQIEMQYRQAQAQYVAACEQYEVQRAEVDDLLQRRDDAYLELLNVPERRHHRSVSTADSDGYAQTPRGYAAADSPQAHGFFARTYSSGGYGDHAAEGNGLPNAGLPSSPKHAKRRSFSAGLRKMFRQPA